MATADQDARRNRSLVNPPPDRLIHLLISASAGSGKTYQLVRRFLHLLALGQDPEAIAAMTFTRKAAGEFFNRILRKLAELAVQPGNAAGYFGDLRPRVAGQPEFARLLRQLTRQMHRLRLGTLDSFFANITTCFPLELGLPAGARVMDEQEAQQARADALDALLERLHGEDQAAEMHALLEAFKQATFGAEEKSVEESLQGWAESGISLWDDSGTGSERGWGDVQRIWGTRSPLTQKPAAAEEIIAEVRASFVPPHERGARLLDETLQAVRDMTPGLTVPKRVKELLEKLIPQLADLQGGRGELQWMNKKLPLDQKAASSLLRLAQWLLGRELAVRVERTRGLAKLMTLYAAEYSQRVQARGWLSFSDVQRLLSRAAKEDSPWLTGGGDLWFRMDGRYQHWLMDEFQDTSRTQWRVLENLVDEVMQDAEGERSFFAVGDPKQSIYLWRQADPELFEDITQRYPEDGQHGLHEEPLSQSFRSAQPVLDAVNAVFGSTQLLSLLPKDSLKGFAFQPHEAAQKELTGHVALLSPRKAAEKLDQLKPVDVAAALLREIEPLRRGLTCAVLVRQNSHVRALTEDLRALTGMPVVCEADQRPVVDNAVTLALLSLLTLAAHPGDKLALEHLQMTPLWQLIDDPNNKGWRYHLAAIQSSVVERGFAECLDEWLPRLRSVLPAMDEFHQLRVAQMMDIAAEFDATGCRDIDAFLEFARDYPMRRRGANRAIQVMTIHAAKGLEFDMVILPTLDGSALDNVKHSDLLISRDHDGVRWVLQSPVKVFVQLDAVLNAERIETERRTAFESLCRLYVAMTRAKRGLYLIATPPPQNGEALKECRLLRETLGVQAEDVVIDGRTFVQEWQTGAADWFASASVQPAPQAVVATSPVALGELLRAKQPMPRRRTPSGEESFRIKGRVLFSSGRDPGRQLGSLVHALLESVEWWKPGRDLTPLREHWRARSLLRGSPVEPDALDQVEHLLELAACAPAFAPLSAQTALWRERPFDMVIGSEWVSGIFDRVLVDHDAAGRITRAWLIDFKTDDAPDEASLEAKKAGYRPQIDFYREALGRLTGLPNTKIRTSLLFTRTGALVDLEATA